MKNTNTEIKSSKKVSDFLEKNNLHKKDFAQMIGVTLSYVYNIIDDSIPFSTRSTTIERISAVMDVLPEEFQEYIIEDDPTPISPNLSKIKDYIHRNKMSVVDFLKLFERKKRLKVVDMLRGHEPLPISILELKSFADILKLNKDEFFELWKNVFTEHLNSNSFNSDIDLKILQEFFDIAKKHFEE